MSGIIEFLLILCWAGRACDALYYNQNMVDNRSVIVQLFEWHFNDIARECEEYLGPTGFGAVQVSPITESRVLEKRYWWDRYQPVTYQINGHSGNEEEFADMVRRCNAADVRIYVDVILNHMATGNDTIIGTAGSSADPTKRDYPAVPFNSSEFNPSCLLEDYQDAQQVRNCDLLGLPDLNHEILSVREKIVAFLNKLIYLGVAGFRLDASKHMWPHDLEEIVDDLNNLNLAHGFEKDSAVFVYMEVIDLGNEPISKYEYNGIGAVTEFLYTIQLAKSFHSNMSLSSLFYCGPEMGFLPSKDSIVFISNHDSQREHRIELGEDTMLSFRDPIFLVLASIFMLSHNYGLPRVMSSYNFSNVDEGPPADPLTNQILSPEFNMTNSCNNGWVCEHRWFAIQKLVQFRRYVHATEVTDIWVANKQIAFSRGKLGFVAINGAASEKMETILKTGLPPGDYCDIITGELVNGNCTGRVFQVNDSGYVFITLPAVSNQSGLVIFAGAKLEVQLFEKKSNSSE